MLEASMPSITKPAEAKAASQSKTRAPVAISRENAEHYRWGVDCDGWYLVRDKNLSVIEEFMPPGTAEIRHHHQHAQQFFYILSGEVLMDRKSTRLNSSH